MGLLVEVKVENSLPINGSWRVPSLSAVDLIPVLYFMEKPVDWTEESVFRATREEDGEIKIEFPVTADFDLLKFCITRVIDGMISAVLDTAWGMEVYARIEKARTSGIIHPQAQVGGPLKL